MHEISYSNNQPSAIDAEAHLAIAATDSTPSSVLAQRHEIDSFLPGLLTSVALKPGPEEAEIAIGMNSGDLALHAACEDGTGTGSMDATTKEDDASVILARLVTSPGDDVMLVGSATFWSMDQSEIREQVAY